jgi:hypothetical protein
VKKTICLGLFAILSGCATVRQVDLDSWVGQPVAALETHPVFLTIPVVKTQTSDGTEIWNYVNGRNIGSCTGGGSVYAGRVDFATYNKFSSCVSGFAACNNIFYIRDGRIVRYTPVGSGGMRCYTDETVQPQFMGATNFR